MIYTKTMNKFDLQMLISGGQTGVDRAALDFALEHEIHCSGWCPMGRKAEDGEIPERYPLKQTNSRLYQHRTRLNVKDSDATLVINNKTGSRGTALTIKTAQLYYKPVILIEDTSQKSLKKLLSWLKKYNPRVLNIAGPRGSESSEVYRLATEILTKTIKKSKLPPPQWPPAKPGMQELFDQIKSE
jgi:predicted Rossmann-fold nucleotide-binding protein